MRRFRREDAELDELEERSKRDGLLRKGRRLYKKYCASPCRMRRPSDPCDVHKKKDHKGGMINHTPLRRQC